MRRSASAMTTASGDASMRARVTSSRSREVRDVGPRGGYWAGDDGRESPGCRLRFGGPWPHCPPAGPVRTRDARRLAPRRSPARPRPPRRPPAEAAGLRAIHAARAGRDQGGTEAAPGGVVISGCSPIRTPICVSRAAVAAPGGWAARTASGSPALGRRARRPAPGRRRRTARARRPGPRTSDRHGAPGRRRTRPGRPVTQLIDWPRRPDVCGDLARDSPKSRPWSLHSVTYQLLSAAPHPSHHGGRGPYPPGRPPRHGGPATMSSSEKRWAGSSVSAPADRAVVISPAAWSRAGRGTV